jgi:hypothetical protein
MLRFRRSYVLLVAFMLLAATLACIDLGGGGSTGGGTGPSLTLNNNSGTTICVVYISPTTDQYWNTQGNRLGSSTISAGSSYTFTGFAAGDYDLRADDCSGNEVDIEWGVSITGPTTWNVP